jgi:phage shock protein C
MTAQESPSRKLYKSRKDKIIDGVCGGIAEYFEIDPTIVRIIWFVSAFLHGLGILAYVIAAIIVPPNPEHQNLQKSEKKTHQPQIVWGILLILFGSFFLLRTWRLPFFWHWPIHIWHWDWWHLPWSVIGPAFLIVLGIFYIYLALKSEKSPEKTAESDGKKKLARPLKNRMISGVCAAFADHFKIDPTWIRIGYVFLTILTDIIPMVILYIVLTFIIPKESDA